MLQVIHTCNALEHRQGMGDQIGFHYSIIFRVIVGNFPAVKLPHWWVVVVVVVVDSHIQRIVLATEETTVTQQVSHRPIKRQSRLWSQRGTKVNGSHHGDNPLLRPTGIQIATKSYAALQAMAPTNIKRVQGSGNMAVYRHILVLPPPPESLHPKNKNLPTAEILPPYGITAETLPR